jgi:molybdopterin molybdotransferase
VTHTHIADDEVATRTALQQSLAAADILILTGGVSKGKFDYIAPLLNEIAGTPLFHGISQRPGKPFTYFDSPIPIFALPGNPLSVMACLARYVIPALKLHLEIPSGLKNLPLSTPAATHPKLTQLLAGRIEDGKIYPSSPNNSGDYAALLGCHGVIEIPFSKTPSPGPNLKPCLLLQNPPSTTPHYVKKLFATQPVALLVLRDGCATTIKDKQSTHLNTQPMSALLKKKAHG